MIEIKYNVQYGIGLNYYSDQYFLTLFISTDSKTRDEILDFRKHVYFLYELKYNQLGVGRDLIIQFEIPKTSLLVSAIKDIIISNIRDLINNETKQLMNVGNKIGYIDFLSRLFIKYGDLVKIYDL